ncbi:MAG: hypothetical protein ACI9U0_000596, partial [Flavobacteriales bacterium]
AMTCNDMQAPKNEKSPKTKVFELICNTMQYSAIDLGVTSCRPYIE